MQDANTQQVCDPQCRKEYVFTTILSYLIITPLQNHYLWQNSFLICNDGCCSKQANPIDTQYLRRPEYVSNRKFA